MGNSPSGRHAILCFCLYFVWGEVRVVSYLNIGHITTYKICLSPLPGSHTPFTLSPTSSNASVYTFPVALKVEGDEGGRGPALFWRALNLSRKGYPKKRISPVLHKQRARIDGGSCDNVWAQSHTKSKGHVHLNFLSMLVAI